MTHLGNCAPGLFIPQALRMLEPLREWMARVELDEVRRLYPGDAPERRAARLGELQRRSLERCPELTCRVLALATFSDERALAERPMADTLDAAYEMLCDAAVTDFFTLLCAPIATTDDMPVDGLSLALERLGRD